MTMHRLIKRLLPWAYGAAIVLGLVMTIYEALTR